MNKLELDKKLNNGERLGFIKETNSPDYLGWILINKMPKMMFKPQEDDYDDEESYSFHLDEYRRREETPYHVGIRELKKDVHERGDYETGDDVRQADNYYFSSVDEVEEFVNQLGYKFENIKDQLEMDAP
jgi:hypothetical protein